MSVVPGEAVPDSVSSQRLEADFANVDKAQGDLAKASADFNPEAMAGERPAEFNMPEPQNQFNAIVGMSPLLAALGAVGGVFGRAHGISMLMTTNAMMKGMVQGADDQYQDARKQYEFKYQQWKDQLRTFNDTYKAYMQAYKGRIDAADRAYKGALAAVGMDAKGTKLTNDQYEKMIKLGILMDTKDEKIRHDKAQEVTDRIKADSAAGRVEVERQNSRIKEADLRQKIKTQDSNQVVATIRGLKEQADTITKQYPASGTVKMPDEMKERLHSIRDQMQMATERLNELQHANAAMNEGYYNEARSAIAQKIPRDLVIKRFRELHPDLDPDKI